MAFRRKLCARYNGGGESQVVGYCIRLYSLNRYFAFYVSYNVLVQNASSFLDPTILKVSSQVHRMRKLLFGLPLMCILSYSGTHAHLKTGSLMSANGTTLHLSSAQNHGEVKESLWYMWKGWELRGIAENEGSPPRLERTEWWTNFISLQINSEGAKRVEGKKSN